MKWIKTGRNVDAQGSTITYQLEGTPYTVESRTRPIPHANRSGTWNYTSYFVLNDGAEVIQRPSLRAAKYYAEVLQGGGWQ